MTTFYPALKTLSDYRDNILSYEPYDKADTIKAMVVLTNGSKQQITKQNLDYINDFIGEKHGNLVFILPSHIIDLDDKEPIQYSFETFIILRDTGLAGYQEGNMIFDTSYHLITKCQYSEQIMFLEYRHGEKIHQIILHGDSSRLLGGMFSESASVKVEYISHAIHDDYEDD